MADTPKIVPPKQGQAPNGKPALVDSTGRIYMRDQAGNLKRVAPDSFGRAIVDEGWEVAIPDDFTREANEDAPWTTAAESFAAGIPEAGLAVPRAAGQLTGSGRNHLYCYERQGSLSARSSSGWQQAFYHEGETQGPRRAH